MSRTLEGVYCMNSDEISKLNILQISPEFSICKLATYLETNQRRQKRSIMTKTIYNWEKDSHRTKIIHHGRYQRKRGVELLFVKMLENEHPYLFEHGSKLADAMQEFVLGILCSVTFLPEILLLLPSVMQCIVDNFVARAIYFHTAFLVNHLGIPQQGGLNGRIVWYTFKRRASQKAWNIWPRQDNAPIKIAKRYFVVSYLFLFIL
jgi:hypothetical protein